MNPDDIPDFVRNSVSWNPWHGCHRVSDGCLNCYMFAGDKSRGIEGSDIVRRSRTQFDLPLRKDRKGKYLLHDRLILTSMTSDFFIEEADAWRDEAWSIIRKRKDCTFIILTKRPHRIPDCLPSDWGEGYPNVRLSVSVENQYTWDERIPLLCAVPARKYDVFMAPMIGPILTDDLLDQYPISCIYLGGEYGPNSRPCDYDWVLEVRESCIVHDVTFHWRNCGQVLIKGGQVFEDLSLEDQGRICCSAHLDHIVDDIMPKFKQTTLM